MVQLEKESFDDTTRYKFTVPETYGDMWKFAVVYLTVTLDSGVQTVRVPIDAEKDDKGLTLLLFHSPSSAVSSVFVSYTKYPGQTAYDAAYCEFGLPLED